MQINNRPAKAPIYDPRKYQRGRMIHKRTSPKSYVTSILFLDMFLMYTEEDTWYTSENKTLCEVHFFVAQYKKYR